MKYTYRVTVECPDDHFEDGEPPSNTYVAGMLRDYALFYGGGCFPGDENFEPDPEFTLYQHARVRVAPIKQNKDTVRRKTP